MLRFAPEQQIAASTAKLAACGHLLQLVYITTGYSKYYPYFHSYHKQPNLDITLY